MQIRVHRPSLLRSLLEELPRTLIFWAWIALNYGLAHAATMLPKPWDSRVTWSLLIVFVCITAWWAQRAIRRSRRKHQRFNDLNRMAQQFSAEGKHLHALYVLGINQYRLYKDPDLFIAAKQELQKQGADLSGLPTIEKTD